MLKPEALEVVIAHIHFFDDPLEGISCALGVRDDRGDEVGNALIRSKLHALGIHQHHANLSGRSPHENRSNHRINKARFTATGGTGHKKVGHLRQVRCDKATLHVFTHTDDHGVNFGGSGG